MTKEQKRFYWIKLRTDFFNKKEIDFLLSQKNGCEYIVLYQMLCLTTANNKGEMSTRIGEMIIPYDVDKILRETKYFSRDTIVVALELFKKLGLIYEEEDKILQIANFDEMVGSECSSAKRVREYREKKALQCNKDVTQEIEYRDKRLEYRDKEIDLDTTTTIYSKFENAFGRTLSNLETQKISEWLLSFKEELILKALNISILNNKVKISYINGILNNWKNQGVKEIEDLENNQKEITDEQKSILDYDWLNK